MQVARAAYRHSCLARSSLGTCQVQDVRASSWRALCSAALGVAVAGAAAHAHLTGDDGDQGPCGTTAQPRFILTRPRTAPRPATPWQRHVVADPEDCHCAQPCPNSGAVLVPPTKSLATPPKRSLVLVVGDSISIGYGDALEHAFRGTADVVRKGKVGRLQPFSAVCEQNGFDGSGTGVHCGNGGDSFDVLRYLEHLAESPQKAEIDVLVLNCGLHDIKRCVCLPPRHRPPVLSFTASHLYVPWCSYAAAGFKNQVALDAYKANVRRILDLAKNQLGIAHVVWVTTTAVNDGVDQSQFQLFRRVPEDVLVYNDAACAVCHEEGVPVVDLYGLTREMGPTAFRDTVHFTPEAAGIQGRFLAKALRMLVGRAVLPTKADLVARKELLTPEQWSHFRKEGWVVLPKNQVFEKEEDFQALRRHIDDIMLGIADVPYDDMMMQLDSATGRYEDSGAQTLGFKGASFRYRKIQNLDLSPLVMKYLRNPLFREACARVYGAQVPIASFRTMFFNKPARQVRSSPRLNLHGCHSF